MGGRSQGAIWIAGHEPEVLRDGGVAAAMNDLGAPVRVVDLWGAPQDGGAPVSGELDAVARRITVRRTDEARQHGALGEIQTLSVLVEIETRGRFHAVRAAAKINLVQV